MDSESIIKDAMTTKATGIALRDNGIILTADIRALTARISEIETTATPIVARALQEARGHLLRASMAVERAQAEREAGA